VEIKIVDIKRVVCRKRGGSQSHLVESTEGSFYVAKFRDNPQGNRTLINEWIAYGLLQRLGVPVPSAHVLRLSESVAIDDGPPWFARGDKLVPVQSGLHLGSKCPVDPLKNAIYDFLPRKLFPSVCNLDDFAKVFVVDILCGQLDTRQAIFVRGRGAKARFQAYFIDHGLAFGGSEWKFKDALFRGMYWDRAIYSIIDMYAICEQALHMLQTIPDADILSLASGAPASWFGKGDEAPLRNLLLELNERRFRLRSLIADQISSLNLDRARLASSGISTAAAKSPIAEGP
jgi:hypothetical protein